LDGEHRKSKLPLLPDFNPRHSTGAPIELKNSGRPPTIGVDFDNTLATYDDLMYCTALERGLISPQVEKNKKSIRDLIRKLPEGEVEWQKVQALVYGPRIADARPADGAQAFLKACARNKVKVYVVSHKTEFASYDETGTNLRCAAISWREQNRIFDGPSSRRCPANLYFESTRQEKLDRIAQLGCTHFIDDLEETFLDKSFPVGVEKILYAPFASNQTAPDVKLAGNWQQITEYLFHATFAPLATRRARHHSVIC